MILFQKSIPNRFRKLFPFFWELQLKSSSILLKFSTFRLIKYSNSSMQPIIQDPLNQAFLFYYKFQSNSHWQEFLNLPYRKSISFP